MIASLLVNPALFKVYIHPNGIIVNLTGLELAPGNELPNLVLCVSAFDEHGLKGPFREQEIDASQGKIFSNVFVDGIIGDI